MTDLHEGYLRVPGAHGAVARAVMLRVGGVDRPLTHRYDGGGPGGSRSAIVGSMAAPLTLGPSLAWLTADRSAVERRLADAGIATLSGHRLALRSSSVRLVQRDGPVDRLVADEEAAAEPPRVSPSESSAAVELVAVGWATVELERAIGADAGAFEEVPDDPHLGAFARRSTRGDRLVLLEPNTEGPLVATLARWGEGPAALYLSVPGDASGDRPGRAGAGAAAVSAVRNGPFGPSVLLLGGPVAGPHVVLVRQRPDGSGDPAMTGTIGTVIDQPTATLRPATAADAERIAALFTDEGYPAGPSDIVARLERFSSAMSTVHVAEHEGEVLGFIAVHLVPRFEHDDRFARVVALVVDAGVRERGIGHLLLAEAERIAREAGAAFIEITAGHHRPEARRLYETVGYDASVAAYLRKRL